MALLAVLLPCCDALRVSFSISSSLKLITIQDFGTSGGSVNVSLSIAPLACTTDTSASPPDANGAPA